MSAAVCGKRLPPFEDVHGSPPVVARRLRNTSSLSPSDNMSRLIALFPAMDPQLSKRQSKVAIENYKQNNFCMLQNALEMASEGNNPVTEKSSLPLHDTIETIPTPNKLTMETTSTAESPKRLRQTPAEPATIIELCTTTTKTVFEGDILAVYGPAQNKIQTSPPKAQILHADFVDRYGLMTITAGINDNLIKRFGTYFSTNKSLRITRFGLKKKGQYDRGDAKYSIVIFPHTIIETIDQVCKVRKLAPDSTIADLLSSNESYSVGSVAAIVVACEYNNRQFDFYIKDGETANDHATLQVSEGYKDLFFANSRTSCMRQSSTLLV